MAFNIIHSKNQWHYNNNLWSKSGPLWEWRRCWNTEQALTDLSVNLGHPGYLLTRTHIFPHTSPLSLTSDVPYCTASQPLCSAPASSLSWWHQADFLRAFTLSPDSPTTYRSRGSDTGCMAVQRTERWYAPSFLITWWRCICFPSGHYSKVSMKLFLGALSKHFLKKLSPFPSPLPCFIIIFSP